MKLSKGFLIVGAALAVLTMSCAHNRKVGGMMDDPQTHTIQGMKYWDKGEYDRAKDEFKLAISLEDGKKYGPAYAGLAMAEAAQGKFDDAEDHADKAIDLCNKDKHEYQGQMAAAIVIEFKNKGDKDNADWWKKAEDHYEDAIEIAPNAGEIYFRQGHMYKLGYEFRKAEDSFKKNLEIKNGYEEESNQEWAVVQKILRAEVRRSLW